MTRAFVRPTSARKSIRPLSPSDREMKKPAFDPKRPLSSRRRPPPTATFSFGSAKWRLFGLMLAVLVVIRMAEAARDPKSWNFLFSKGPTETVEKVEAEPDSKIPFKPSATHYDPPGTFVAAHIKPAGAHFTAQNLDQPIDASAVKKDDHAAVDSAWREAWRDIFPRLANEDRALFYRSLKAARDGAVLDEKYRAPLAALLETLDRTWTGYQAEATGSLNDLSDQEKVAWLDVLRQLAVRWTESLAPALKALSGGEKPSGDQLTALADIQSLLDQILLAAVKDDSVWRTGEAEIWFRMVERVQAWKSNDPELAKVPEATYVQLFKQSHAYRGETVRVKGNVREAWHIKAWDNWCGVEGYYVFVLKPPEATSPIFIYALELPPGFPPVNDLDKNREGTKMNEEIEFTGVFFKRWAYPGKDGSFTAPLLVAKVGKWSRSVRPFQEPVTAEKWQSLLTLAICMCAALSVGVLVIWRYQFRRGPRMHESPDLAAELRALEKLPTGPTVKEQLRDLENQG